MTAQKNDNQPKSSAGLWIAGLVNLIALLFAYVVAQEMVWIPIVLAVTLAAIIAGLIVQHKRALGGRAAAYGLQSGVTVLLVLGLVGVINFLANQHPLKWDLTKNKIHTLSDETKKVIQGLKEPVKVVYWGRGPQKEEVRPTLENYKALNPSKFEIEYVDVNREVFRAKQAGIKKLGQLQILMGKKEQKIDEVNEEKLTNAIIKMNREKIQKVCFTNGHGEKAIEGPQARDALGYDRVNQSLKDLAYETRTLNLVQDAKDLPTCDALVIAGPSSPFFAPEVKTLEDYLANGGHAAILVDLNPKGTEFAPELIGVLNKWYVRPLEALSVDLFGQQLAGDATLVRMASFSKDSSITKDFYVDVYFPIMRPLEIIPGAPAGMNVSMLAQTDKSAWGVTNLKSLANGVLSKQPDDKSGPLIGAITVDGKQKDSKATKNTRLVVFGTSLFPTNQFGRFGGNFDFFTNSISWLLEDESVISIHSREEGPGKVDLSVRTAAIVRLITVLLIPFLVVVGGIAIWTRRRKL